MRANTPDPFDHVQQVIRAIDIRVSIGADCIPALFDTANSRNLTSDFSGRQYAAFPRLCTLTEFDFKHAYSVMSGNLRKPFVREVSCPVAHTEFGCAYLKYQVRTAFEVVG